MRYFWGSLLLSALGGVSSLSQVAMIDSLHMREQVLSFTSLVRRLRDTHSMLRCLLFYEMI